MHKPASKSLTAEWEWMTAVKNIFVGSSTYYTNKKKKQKNPTNQKQKRVLTTRGALPVQSVNPLKRASLCLRDKVNKPCS